MRDYVLSVSGQPAVKAAQPLISQLSSDNAGATDGSGDGNDGNRGRPPAHVQRRLPRRILCGQGRPYSL
jgi:hypothetical protein